jgi:hypothetical protein
MLVGSVGDVTRLIKASDLPHGWLEMNRTLRDISAVLDENRGNAPTVGCMVSGRAEIRGISFFIWVPVDQSYERSPTGAMEVASRATCGILSCGAAREDVPVIAAYRSCEIYLRSNPAVR